MAAEPGMTVECSICGEQTWLGPGDQGPLSWFMAHRERWHSGAPIVAVEVPV